MSGQERTEDGCEAEVEQPTEQGQRPVWMRKPLNCYGEWILNWWSTADVGPLKGQDKKVQEADEDSETKIAGEGKNTAGKLFILSVR